MKRTHSNEAEDEHKRSKSGLAFLRTALQQLKACSSTESWHAAKQLVSEGSVAVTGYDDDKSLGCICISGLVTAPTDNAAAFPHLKPPREQSTPQPVSAQLILHPSTGHVLDADTSCCPGGFQPVLGSFCPYLAAALLKVAQQAQPPSQGAMQSVVSPGEI
jgi:hypothetical protein